MSAKGRRKTGAVPFDYFPTPPWCVHRLLDAHAEDLGIFAGHDVQVLEPTVGDGAIVRAAESWGGLRSADALPAWTGVELRRGALLPGTRLARHVEGVDFRRWSPGGELLEELYPTGTFDLSLGNPPFSLAEGIIRHAMELSHGVVMLLRVGFLGASERVEFWRAVGADPFVRVLPDRPSFDGEGTDSATYAWFVWNVELTGPRVDVLDTTPASVRAAQVPSAPRGLPQIGLFDSLGGW